MRLSWAERQITLSTSQISLFLTFNARLRKGVRLAPPNFVHFGAPDRRQILQTVHVWDCITAKLFPNAVTARWLSSQVVNTIRLPMLCFRRQTRERVSSWSLSSFISVGLVAPRHDAPPKLLLFRILSPRAPIACSSTLFFMTHSADSTSKCLPHSLQSTSKVHPFPAADVGPSLSVRIDLCAPISLYMPSSAGCLVLSILPNICPPLLFHFLESSKIK